MKKFPVLVLSVVLAASVVASAEEPAGGAAEQQMMEMWQKMSTPGSEHAFLGRMEGTWDAKVRWWMEPGGPPQESAGTSVNRMVLGGRWLEQRYTGTMWDQPFEGLGYTGFDNHKQEYTGWWIDTSSTAGMMMTGRMDESGASMTCTGSMDDFMTGGSVEMKEVLTITDDDHHKAEMWMSGPDGAMFKNMEIEYSRKK